MEHTYIHLKQKNNINDAKIKRKREENKTKQNNFEFPVTWKHPNKPYNYAINNSITYVFWYLSQIKNNKKIFSFLSTFSFLLQSSNYSLTLTNIFLSFMDISIIKINQQIQQNLLLPIHKAS